MRFLFTALAIGAVGLQVAAAPSNSQKTSCTNPRIRKEWRYLSIDERKKYIGAVKCMMEKPAKFKTQFPIVESRFDDFVALHVNISLGGRSPDTAKPPGKDGPGEFFEGGHDGNILAWHRYLLAMWEDAIVEECNWHLGLPYWNWYLDVPDAGNRFEKSPIWNPDHGFGGNGQPSNITVVAEASPFPRGNGGGCVTDGPFKDTRFRIGPFGRMMKNKTHCLSRDINAAAVEKEGGISKIRKTMKSKNFKEFMAQVQPEGVADGLPGVFGPKGHGGHGMPAGGGPFGGKGGKGPSLPFGAIPEGMEGNLHFIAHGAIGGEMLDPLNSLNEPLFYLHHGAIDYLWAIWQEQDLKSNLYDLDSTSKRELGEKAWTVRVEMGAFAPPATVKQLGDPSNRDGTGILCFKYEGLTAKDYFSEPPPQAPKSP